ncbi:MAG: ABC transporter permease subunit [Xanthomonadales bacterium]|nr:Inner membrane ABC transporter permease protein YdcV [Xanthomonadales bacterium]MCC6592906.1 ABC transporter permease subunit [Xanthomonadales bacterium]MCE7930765.1 ABC transporter permease subunit [Xanthomonadales bacterium PRO6]
MNHPRNSAWTWSFLGLGFFFLYAPMLSLIVYSFNENRLVTVWSRFSTKWYAALFQDEQMLGAAWVSLKIAFFTACAAVVLGTMAAMVMTRLRAFRGKTLFAAMVTAPLVMPEVITGLSLLLLFVSLSTWTGFDFARGMTTIWVAHVTLTMAFVTVIISSRLAELDRSLEEAAMDLGANRIKVFFVITLPIIAPALVSGWLLAFTLSLDDLVLASFVSGPSSTTLPMQVFSSARMGVSPKINALATILIVTVSTVGVIGWYFMQRAERRRQREMLLAVKQ